MNKFFRYLDLVTRSPGASGGVGSRREKLFEQLRQIWVASSTPSYGSPDEERAWQRLQLAIDSIDAEERPRTRNTPMHANSIRIRRVAIGIGFAAAVLAVVLFGTSLLDRKYRSGREADLNIVLSDSSTVTLRKNTSLTVRNTFLRSTKGVDVEGEAYFNMKAQRSPFVVSTSVGFITVVGTRFDVRCDGRALYIAVNYGAVSVSTPHAKHGVLVHAGEYLVSTGDAAEPTLRQSLTSGEPIWLTGRFLVNRASLKDVCEEIGRELGVEIRISNHALDAMTVTGLIQGKDAPQVLAAITGLTGTAFQSQSNGYVVY